MSSIDANDNIGRRAARGGASLLAGEAATRVAGVAALLFLASILSPADFGAVAVATFVITAISTPLGLGLGSVLQSLDQSRELDRTSLFLAVALGCLAMVLVFLAAPLITTLLGTPGAAPYVRALAPIALLTRWTEVRLAMIERRLSFGPAAAVNAGSTVLGVVVAIVAALAGAGPWALVLQVLTMHAGAAIGTTLIDAGEWRPQLHSALLPQLWRYFRPVLANSTLAFLYSNADDAAVARVTGAVGLGFYSFAYRISNLPTYVLTHTINRVMLPTYRTLAATGQGWALPFRSMVRVLSLVAGTLLFGVLVHGPAVLNYLYGQRWAASYPVLRVLTMYGLFRTMGATTGAVFLASGRPWLVRQVAQWQTLVMLALLLPAVLAVGITGAAVAVTVPLAVATIYAVGLASRIAGVAPARTLTDIGLAWSLTAIANVIALPAVWAIDGLAGFAAGAVIVTVVVAAYGALRLRAELSTLLGSLRKLPSPATRSREGPSESGRGNPHGSESQTY